jgi:phosphatidate cytidylyltransferase
LEGSPRGGRRSHREPHKAGTLGVRVLAGAVLIPIALLVNHTGGLVFAVFISLLAGCGSYEFYRMLGRRGLTPSTATGVVASVCVCFSFFLGAVDVAGLVLTVVVGVVLIERLIRQDRETFVIGSGITILGALYTGWLLGYYILLRNSAYASDGSALNTMAGSGRQLVYLVLALTWSYDSIAYLAGSSLGRHKLFSRVSPSKTLEGTLSGLAACVAAALISRATFASFLSTGEAVVAGLLVGVAAQAGDLIESMIKRSTGAKDSSRVIPGHGGILDRLDSLLLTGPALYFYIRLMLIGNRP